MAEIKPFPSFYFRDRHALCRYLEGVSDDDVAATLYTHQIGRVFTGVAVVEDVLSQALLCCENVEVDGRNKVLPDIEAYQKRRGILKDQTFGNLIQILQRNGLSEAGISYLKFVKRMRDQFVHRFFEDNLWPGDISDVSLVSHSRTLAAYEIIFCRAQSRIWKILGQEIFHEFVDLGSDGFLIMNDLEAALDELVPSKNVAT